MVICMSDPADLIMLTGLVRPCPDCGDARIFVSTDECGDDRCEFCCSTCGAAVLIDPLFRETSFDAGTNDQAA